MSCVEKQGLLNLEGFYLGDGSIGNAIPCKHKAPTSLKIASLSAEAEHSADSITLRMKDRYSLTGL